MVGMANINTKLTFLRVNHEKISSKIPIPTNDFDGTSNHATQHASHRGRQEPTTRRCF